MAIADKKGPIVGVLVSDFDGTMTHHDFYKLALEHLLPSDVPNYWDEYRRGNITHFEALRRYFAAIRKSEMQVLSVVEQMELDPRAREAVESLQNSGWRVIVASAGCQWYISWWLTRAGVEVEVHANPGRFEEGKGLLMLMPVESPYWSATLGIDKSAIVNDYLNRGIKVAYAGDGFPDAAPARLVSDDLRFARGDLAEVLRGEGLPFQAFNAWSEIANRLLLRKF